MRPVAIPLADDSLGDPHAVSINQTAGGAVALACFLPAAANHATATFFNNGTLVVSNGFQVQSSDCTLRLQTMRTANSRPKDADESQHFNLF
eukprot:m.465768 g.465768  ORF g.465768 m.465768 type:complete len:92 (+) comp24536_c0_seq1:157-432(+)